MLKTSKIREQITLTKAGAIMEHQRTKGLTVYVFCVAENINPAIGVNIYGRKKIWKIPNLFRSNP